MPRGSRLLLASLGLVALVTFVIGWVTFPSFSPVAQFQYGGPRNENYRPGGANCEPSALAKIANAKVRLHQAEHCQKDAEEYRQSSDDLIQQTRAANAAQAQADIASQQLWAGWFQTLGGFLTLAAAVGAAIYARYAARQTHHANVIASESQRPWLELVVGNEIQTQGTLGSASYSVNIPISLKNHGGIPAVRVSVNVVLVMVTQGFHYQSEYDRLAKRAEVSADDFGITVHPGGEPVQFNPNMHYVLNPMEDALLDQNRPGSERTPYIGVAAIYHRPGSRRRYYVLRFFRPDSWVWGRGAVKIEDMGGEHHGYIDRD